MVEKIIADEDIPRPIVEKLRAEDIQIFYIEEEMKSVTDQEVIKKSFELNRPILTFDDDFQNFTENNGILHITTRTRYEYVVKAIEDVLGFLPEEDLENSIIKINPNDYK